MSVGPVEAGGFAPWTASTLTPASNSTPGVPGESHLGGLSGAAGPSAVTGAAEADGASFASMLTRGLESVSSLQQDADRLAVQAATGDLANLHDYTIAASEASVATQLTATVRNKAIEAFTEIMRMPI